MENTRSIYFRNEMVQESEIIVPIDLGGYTDYYISNMGRVFSRKRKYHKRINASN